MTGREHVLAHCAMTFVSLSFSIWNVLAQSVTDGGADPLIFAFVREVGAAPLLLIASSAFVGLPRPRSRRDALNILLVGATGPWGVQLFYILGIANAGAEKTAIFQLLTPVLTVLFAAALGMEKYTLCPPGAHPQVGSKSDSKRHAVYSDFRRSWVKVIGILLGVGGLLPLVGISNLVGSGGSRKELLGCLYLLISDVLGAAYILLLKPLYARGYAPLAICAYSYTVAAVGMCVVVSAVRSGTGAAHKYWAIGRREAEVLVYAVLVCSSLNYALMTWANAHMEGTVFAIYGGLQPVFTALISLGFAEGAQFTSGDALGGVLVFIGLVCVSFGQQQGGANGADAVAVPNIHEDARVRSFRDRDDAQRALLSNEQRI